MQQQANIIDSLDVRLQRFDERGANLDAVCCTLMLICDGDVANCLQTARIGTSRRIA
jgi:hypothetical protein